MEHNPTISDYWLFSVLVVDDLNANSQNPAREQRPITVVIIDPSPVFRRTLRKMIRDRIPNVNIAETDDFEQARKIMEIEPPGVVFLDIAIFPNNCIDHIRSIKNQQPGSVIIVLTTHDSAEHKAAFLEYGADYFFSKTNTPSSSLINMIEKSFS